jgi:hypothetical protein
LDLVVVVRVDMRTCKDKRADVEPELVEEMDQFRIPTALVLVDSELKDSVGVGLHLMGLQAQEAAVVVVWVQLVRITLQNQQALRGV